jgi:hypothetical protein
MKDVRIIIDGKAVVFALLTDENAQKVCDLAFNLAGDGE